MKGQPEIAVDGETVGVATEKVFHELEERHHFRLPRTAPSDLLEAIPLATATFTLAVAVDPTGRWAFTAHAADRTLAITDLTTGESRGVTWLDRAGPTYVAIVP